MRPVQDLPAVPWEEAEKLEKEQRAGKDGVSVGESKTGAQDATAKDWKPKRDAESAAVTRAEPIVDAEGYTILDKAGTLKKKVLKKGAGPLMKPQTILQVHYIGWIVSAPDFKEEEPKEFHNTYAIDDPLEFVHGEGQELPVWEETIPTMQTGEKCEIICGPEYGFDAKGYDDIVPPNATLKFHLEILFAKPPEDPIEIRLADAQELKDRGNTHFKSGAFLLAQTAYEEALARLSHTWGMSLSQDVEITKFRATVNANLSLAYLRTKDCDKAITAADDGLVHNQHSAKLWYRKAQALRGLERWDEAVKAGNMAEEYDPDDSSIRAFNKSLPGAREEAKRREKRMYEQMFSSDKNTPSPSPSTPISADNNATADAAPEAALDGAA
ncbi:hypothetical protein DFJ77DRAFT_471582 [Powellomyces hirtus]|nr:hypothetical protein DFJ77DRAFT_471582 [Powellomyces hirtus]